MALLGNIMNPPIPYVGSFPGGNMTPERQIIIQGMVPQCSEGFGINLANGPSIGNPRSDTPLHFNPRFNECCVVRNSLKGMKWAKEERHNGMPFGHQMPFEIVIMADQYCYKISVNNNHFCEFQHRLPLTGVNTLTIEGSITINSIRFLGPQPPPYQPPATFSYPSVQPPVSTPLFNPAIPLMTGIPNGLFHGKMILISGTPTAPTRFTINLQEGGLHNADIGLHFDVRIRISNDTNTVVRNHRTRGQWGQEERAIPYFPFVPNAPFEMIILCENTSFKVALNNQHLVEFKHRLMPFAKFNMLNITGDICISQVRFQ